MRSKSLAAQLIVACLALAVCAGCINYEEEIALNKDGSGTVTMHYWVSEDFAAIAEQKEKEAKGEQKNAGLPFSQDQAERVFNIEKVLSITSGPTINKTLEKGYRHITIACEFDDINHQDFPPIPLFEGGSISFAEDEKGNMAFKRVLRSPEQKEHENQESDGKGAQAVKDAPRNEGEQEISLEEDPGDPGDTLASSVFSEYKLKFVVHFPGRILKTNGTFYEEGEEPSAFEWLWGHRKAVWEFRLADIARKGDLTATVRTRWPIEWIVIIAIVVIAIVLIIIKSKPGAAEAESKPDEAKEQENPQSDNKKELSTILK